MIDKLEFLLALARERNFGKAAEQCGVTQPTLSAGIKQLEGMLGVMLVQRSSRFLGLTEEGERVLEWARRIVGDARAMRQEVQALREGLVGHLRIAAHGFQQCGQPCFDLGFVPHGTVGGGLKPGRGLMQFCQRRA